MRIALLEDDEEFAGRIVEWLQQAGHATVHFTNGKDFLRALPNERLDLCLFDWMLPDMNGPDVMAHMKLKGMLPPVIFLTVRDAEEDVVRALEAGADDYVVKPPNRNILLTRIHALARRSLPPPQPGGDFGRIHVDFEQRRFAVDGEAVYLSEKESALALYLFAHAGELMSRDHLIQAVWGAGSEIGVRTVDVYMCYLRNKLRLTPERGWRLVSVYHHGYRLVRVE